MYSWNIFVQICLVKLREVLINFCTGKAKFMKFISLREIFISCFCFNLSLVVLLCILLSILFLDFSQQSVLLCRVVTVERAIQRSVECLSTAPALQGFCHLTVPPEVMMQACSSIFFSHAIKQLKQFLTETCTENF